MAAEQDTPEVASIKSRIESYLDSHKNKLDIDLTQEPLDFNRHSDTLFTAHKSQIHITLGFDDSNLKKTSSVDQFRSSFSFIALDHLPVPGLDGIPSQWEVYPQTPISSFSEGVTLEQYDPNTQILQLSIKTNFFAIYGHIPQQIQAACAPAPKGTYLQVRREIQGHIKIHAKLIFN